MTNHAVLHGLVWLYSRELNFYVELQIFSGECSPSRLNLFGCSCFPLTILDATTKSLALVVKRRVFSLC